MAETDAEIVRYGTPSEDDDRQEELSPGERTVLDTINRRVAGAESVVEIVDFLFDSTRDISPCDRIGLAFVEEDGRRAVAYHARATYEPMVLKKGYAEDLEGSSLRAILETGNLRIINDLGRYLELHPASTSTKLLVREGVHSSLTCPLKVEGRIVGLLFRSARKPFAYDDRHMRMHRAVGERLSQAVEKAYRIEQLNAANRAYIEMLGFVSHELKSPVASMVMDAHLLTQGYLGELDSGQREKLQGMIRKGEHLLGLIREYLDLARMETGELSVRPRIGVDFVSEVIDPAVEIVRSLLENKRMRLVREIRTNDNRVECDSDLLRIVLVNLLGNAIKYGYEAGEIRLRVERQESCLSVSVRNEGPGFPETERSRLFRKFSRLQTPELRKEKGTGVGLYTVWRIMQLHRGRIRAASEPGQWAEFSFDIPQPLLSGFGNGIERE